MHFSSSLCSKKGTFHPKEKKKWRPCSFYSYISADDYSWRRISFSRPIVGIVSHRAMWSLPHGSQALLPTCCFSVFKMKCLQDASGKYVGRCQKWLVSGNSSVVFSIKMWHHSFKTLREKKNLEINARRKMAQAIWYSVIQQLYKAHSVCKCRDRNVL